MENKKSPILIYREKKNEMHTPEEIKAAFEDSFVICFNIESDVARGKISLFTSIWELNPSVLITETDLCVMRTEPVAVRDQFLLVNKNGSKEISNKIVKLIEESGIVQSAYCFLSEKKAGIKGCYRVMFDSKKASPLYKGNLILDGSNLLLTVRHMNKADREAVKSQKE